MDYEKFVKETWLVSGVYKITNLSNNKVYIGSSTNIIKRIKSHFYELRQNKHRNKALNNDYNLQHKFDISILELVDNHLDLHKIECLFINTIKNLYNKIKENKEIIIPDNCLEDFKSNFTYNENGCWDYDNKLDQSKYGQYKNYLAHRVSYFLHYHIQPGNYMVGHTCNRKCCVNPSHLYLTSCYKNCLDARDAGLGRKLNLEMVKDIRRKHKNENIDAHSLVIYIKEKYNIDICISHIHGILSNYKWKDDFKQNKIDRKMKLNWEIVNFIRSQDVDVSCNTITKIINEKFDLQLTRSSIQLVMSNKTWVDPNYNFDKNRRHIKKITGKKLTWEIVKFIRSQDYSLECSEIAEIVNKKFNLDITRSNIHLIIHNINWKDSEYIVNPIRKRKRS